MKSTEPSEYRFDFGERPKRPATRAQNVPTYQRIQQLGPTIPRGFKSVPQQKQKQSSFSVWDVPIMSKTRRRAHLAACYEGSAKLPAIDPHGFPILRTFGVPEQAPRNPEWSKSLLNKNAAIQLNAPAPRPVQRHLPSYVQNRPSRQIPAAPRAPTTPRIHRRAIHGDDAYLNIPQGPVTPEPQVMSRNTRVPIVYL